MSKTIRFFNTETGHKIFTQVDANVDLLSHSTSSNNQIVLSCFAEIISTLPQN